MKRIMKKNQIVDVYKRQCKPHPKQDRKKAYGGPSALGRSLEPAGDSRSR